MISQKEQEAMCEVFAKITSERIRQLQLMQRQIIAVDLFDRDVSLTDKLVFPVEELGEVARAVRNKLFQPNTSPRYDPTPENLETELVQLATHTVVWRASLI